MLLEGVHIPLSGARECTTLPGTSNFASGIKLRNLTWAIILDDPNSLSVITRALRGKEGDRRVRVREGDMTTEAELREKEGGKKRKR